MFDDSKRLVAALNFRYDRDDPNGNALMELLGKTNLSNSNEINLISTNLRLEFYYLLDLVRELISVGAIIPLIEPSNPSIFLELTSPYITGTQTYSQNGRNYLLALYNGPIEQNLQTNLLLQQT